MWIPAVLVAAVLAAQGDRNEPDVVQTSRSSAASVPLTVPSLPGSMPSIPATSLPPVTLPPLTLPPITLPPITLPDITLPTITLPTLPLPLPEPDPPFTIDGSGLWLIDADHQAGRLVLSGHAVVSVSFSPGGSEVAFAAHEADDFSGWIPTFLGVLDLTTGAIRRLAPGARTPQAVRWSPDGQWIAYTQFPDPNGPPPPLGGEIWIVRPDGSDNRRLAYGDGGWFLRWSPDSMSILQPRPNVNDVGITAIADGTVRSIPIVEPHLAEWLPDGQSILVSGQDDSTYRIDVDSGSATKISDGRHCRPSPDGLFIAVRFGGVGGRTQITTLNGGVARDVGPGSPVNWSADGRSLSFLAAARQVDVFDAITGQVRTSVQSDGVQELSPRAWSPTAREFLVIASPQTAFYGP